MADDGDGLLTGMEAALGQPLALDDSGQCVLLFDGDVEIVISVAAQQVMLRATLLPSTADRAVAALALNYGRLPLRMSVALDPPSNLLVLFASAAEGMLAGEELVSLVAEMVGLVPQLRSSLQPDKAEAGPHLQMPGGIRG
jgi:hypothetical protein